MNPSLSCNSLRVYHHVSPKSRSNFRRSRNWSRKCKKLCVPSRGATTVYSEVRIHRGVERTGERQITRRSEVVSRKTTISSQWNTRPDGMSFSAPTTSFDEIKDECSDVISVVSTHAEQLIPEREHVEIQQREDMNDKLESLKTELLQCREAVTYSDAQILQLTEELKTARITMVNEKEKMTKQIHILTRTLNDHKASVKSLTDERQVKDMTIANLKGSLSKTEASNACRAVTIKSLKQEIQLLRKDLAEAATSESLLQKCNKELLVENSKLKLTLDGLKNKLSLLQESNAEWETVMNKRIDMLTREGEDNHFQCSVLTSQKLGSLKASYDHRLQLLLKKLFRADRKTKQLYQTIEKIIKGLHLHLYTDELEKLAIFESDLVEGVEMPRKNAVLHLGDWLDTCHDLAYKKNFSSELSAFILNLLESDDKCEHEDSTANITESSIPPE